MRIQGHRNHPLCPSKSQLTLRSWMAWLAGHAASTPHRSRYGPQPLGRFSQQVLLHSHVLSWQQAQTMRPGGWRPWSGRRQRPVRQRCENRWCWLLSLFSHWWVCCCVVWISPLWTAAQKTLMIVVAGWLMSKQYVSVSQGPMWSDYCACRPTEI